MIKLEVQNFHIKTQNTDKSESYADSVSTDRKDANVPIDLISRADALQCKPEFLNPNPNDKPNNYHIGWNDAIKAWYQDINALPSAETTGALDDAIAMYVADGYMLPPSGDLISRAEAIDAVCHNCAYYTDAQCKTDSGYWCESGAMIREDIQSAERVVRCKDCEYWNNETDLTYCVQGHWYGTDADDYCSFAKMKGGTE